MVSEIFECTYFLQGWIQGGAQCYHRRKSQTRQRQGGKEAKSLKISIQQEEGTVQERWPTASRPKSIRVSDIEVIVEGEPAFSDLFLSLKWQCLAPSHVR